MTLYQQTVLWHSFCTFDTSASEGKLYISHEVAMLRCRSSTLVFVSYQLFIDAQCCRKQLRRAMKDSCFLRILHAFPMNIRQPITILVFWNATRICDSLNTKWLDNKKNAIVKIFLCLNSLPIALVMTWIV